MVFLVLIYNSKSKKKELDRGLSGGEVLLKLSGVSFNKSHIRLVTGEDAISA